MKRKTWKKHHKYIGILMLFFFSMFCISGILLNHRKCIEDFSVSRRFLPEKYQYKKWNNGLLRASIRYKSSVLIYGDNGIWETKDEGESFQDYNKGLPKSQDQRVIRKIIKNWQGELFAVGQWQLFHKKDSDEEWTPIPIPLDEDEKLCDIIEKGSDLYLLSRSHLFEASYPYTNFKIHPLPAPQNYEDKCSLFTLVWNLHSGQVWGLTGRLIVDVIGVVLLIICLTGFLFTLFRWIAKLKKRKSKRISKILNTNLQRHNFFGRKTLLLTLFITLTGWALRPPLLIPLAKISLPTPPLTTLKSDNPWKDKLRALRFDASLQEWIFSTSKGFFHTKDLHLAAESFSQEVPVSVMGINVWEKDPKNSERYIIASFSGIFYWSPRENKVWDYYTLEEVHHFSKNPFGQKPISGYSDDFCSSSHMDNPEICGLDVCRAMVVNYQLGSDELEQPKELSLLPMSLWHLALEVHTGRIYSFLGNMGALLFISIIGLFALWAIWSGKKVQIPLKRRSLFSKKKKKEESQEAS